MDGEFPNQNRERSAANIANSFPAAIPRRAAGHDAELTLIPVACEPASGYRKLSHGL